MKKKLYLSCLVFCLIGCALNKQNQVSPPKKIEYVKTCSETSSEELCSCQFDVIDPILSESINDNWTNQPIKEKDYDTYVAAVQKAVEKCV